MKFNMTAVKEFFSSKKGKATVVTVISGAVLYFFPESADAVGNVAHYLADIAAAIGDKVQPVAESAVTVAPQ